MRLLLNRTYLNLKQELSSLFLFLFILILFSSKTVRADEPVLPLSGRVFSDFYVPIKKPSTGSIQQSSVSAWLQADPKLGEFGSAHVIFTADDFEASSIPGRAQFKAGLREGHIDYSKQGWDLRVGKMIIPWGKSDVINPTDFLSAKDYTFFNPDEEVRRVGAASLFLAYTPEQGSSPWTFTFIGTPVFPKTRLLIPPEIIPSNVTVAADPVSPTTSLANSEAAFKVSYAGRGWDFSTLAYHGWNHLPDFQVSSLTFAGSTLMANMVQNFHRYSAVGGDLSANWGRWVIRAESAYVWTENNDGRNPLIQPSHLDSVVGVETPIGNDFRVQAQFVARYFPRFQDPRQAGGNTPVQAFVNQQVAQTNALLQNYQDRFRPASTFRISYTHDPDGLMAELFLLMNWVGGDYLLRPQLSYLLTDSFKLTTGVDYYAGPVDRPLGALAIYSAAFAEAKYSF